MTVTAPEITTTPAASNMGDVGSRVLTMIQMFDIARQTNHIAYLVAGAFVVVSGEGPKGDSNGSGKTSFQAACSVLLGDPLWNMRANHGKNAAAGLLFEAEAAGADDGTQSNAPHGYIVGVFSPRNDPHPDACITVWVRLSTTSPYLRVRTSPGVILATADRHDDRAREADILWDQLSSKSEMSAHVYSERLYGDAPRCVSYLDTAMRQNSPSLLSQQMTQMTPAEIGASLVELSGMAPLLEQEQEQRSKLAEAEEKVAQDAVADTAVRISEESELESIRGREEARTQLAAGELAWRLHWAKGLLDADEDHSAATATLGDATAALDTLRRRADTEKTAWETLRDRRDLADARDRAKQAAADARAAVARKQSEISEVNATITVSREQIASLRNALQGWDGTSTPAQAQEGAKAAAAAKVNAEAMLILAQGRRDDASATLEAAESGASPSTAPALDALQSAGVKAAGLLDVITVDEPARPFWEAALTPWSHAVVVRDTDAAVRAVAHLPGTTIVTSGAVEPLPSGLSSTEPIGSFLAALAARHTPIENPDGVVDTTLGTVTISGAPNPTTGRAERVRAAHSALAEAEATLSEARAVVERAAGRVELAEARANGAAAERDRASHVANIAGRNLELSTLNQEKVALDDLEDLRVTEYDDARGLATNHAATVSAYEATWTRTREDVTKSEDTVHTAQQRVENARLPYWRTGWDGTLDQAREFIDAQPERPLAVVRYRGRASEALQAAVAAYVGKLIDVPEDLAAIHSARGKLLDDDGTPGSRTPSFRDIARPLRDRLDSAADRDAINGERIQADRERRQTTLDAQHREVEDGRSSLNAFQGMVEGLVQTHFERMKAAFNELDITAKGFGATLDVVTVRPATATTPWQFEVTPRWRRSPGRAFVSYKKVSNGAQIKVHAILIALAALRANPGDGGGQVVIIDELGNSLGDMNRNDVLEALRSVSESQHLTILGTCQDSVLKDAVVASKQLLWFTHASATDVLNRPVQMWDFDKDSAHARLAAPYMQVGRPLA